MMIKINEREGYCNIFAFTTVFINQSLFIESKQILSERTL